MRVRTNRVPALVLAVGLLGMLPAGCGSDSSGDKAGGSHAPVTLRLAVAYSAREPDAAAVRDFASRVAGLSDGSLRVRVVFDAAGHESSAPEERVARMVHDGDFPLGWIAARAWDRRGVTSLQALQAPFLVDSQALLARIATGPLASRMLAGLDDDGYIGLALVPDRLRHPLGVKHPLASPEDFSGARVRVIPSRASDALMQALGATPVHVSNEDIDTAMSNGEIDGSEIALGGSFAGGRYLTPNVTLFAKALTLFADRSAYERLDDDQRSVIRRAAQQTVARVAAHPPSETALVRRFCEAGRVVLATKADAAALDAGRRARLRPARARRADEGPDCRYPRAQGANARHPGSRRRRVVLAKRRPGSGQAAAYRRAERHLPLGADQGRRDRSRGIRRRRGHRKRRHDDAP